MTRERSASRMDALAPKERPPTILKVRVVPGPRKALWRPGVSRVGEAD